MTIDSDAVAVYVQAAHDAGCPPDQIERFLRAGVILHPKQLRASAAARLCDFRCPRCEDAFARNAEPIDDCADCGPTSVGYAGSRSAGKSYWMFAQMGCDDCQRFPGLKCLVLRKIGKTGTENFADFRMKLFRNLPHRTIDRDNTTEFANGSRILTGHYKDESDIDQYIGVEYDEIGIEESSTLSESKKNNVKGSLRTSKKGWRPREYETWNPGGSSHQQLKKKYVIPGRQGRETDTRYIHAVVADNPSVNPEYVSRVLKKYTGWQRKAWLDGDMDIDQGQFFVNFRYEDHVLPAATFDLPTTWDVWGCLDYGLTHYTAFYLMARSDDGDVFYLGEHAERGWAVAQHAVAIKALLARWEKTPADLAVVLAGEDCFQKRQFDDQIGTLAMEYAKHGIDLTRANVQRVPGAAEFARRLGAPSPSPEIPAVRPTAFLLDSCPRLIECLPALQHSKTNPEDVQKVDCDENGEGGDDSYDAARYGLMRFAPSYAPSSAPPVAGPSRDFASYAPR